MNSAKQRNRYRTVLREFGLHWESQGKFEWIGKSIAIFPCSVSYHLKGKTRKVETRGHITHEGKVELYESDWLNVDDHYTGFNVDWQRYEFTDENALRIEGDGPKVNGKYWLEITPI